VKPHSLDDMSKLLDVLAGTAGTPGDLTSTLQHIARMAQTFFAADSCVIFAINPITSRFIESLTVSGNLLRGDKASYKEPSEGGLEQQVLRQGVLVVEDLEDRPEYQSKVTRAENIRAFAALALYRRHHRQPLGVVYLNFRQPQQFNLDDYKLLQTFADQASFILQETWLLWRYQEVARIGQEINHELGTVDILFQKLQKYLPEILDTTYALLLAFYQPQTNTLDLYVEEEGQYIVHTNSPLDGACQYVIETRQTLFIEHLSKMAEHPAFQPVKIITGNGSKESLIFVPLELRDIPLGVLSIQHPQPNAYIKEDLSILQLLAPHIALALHNMRLYNSLDQLNKTGQILTQQLDSEQALQATVDKIRDAAKADIVVLYPYDHALRRFVLTPIIAGRLLNSTIQIMSPGRPGDTIALLLQRKEPIFAKNSATFYTSLHGKSYIPQGSFGQREMVRSLAALPLQIGDELVGILFVNFRQPQRFDATEKLFIDGLAHFAAVAVKNARLFGTLTQRRVRELEILQDIDRELSLSLELKPVLDTILKLGNERVPADGASILLYNSRIKALETTATIGQHAKSRQAYIIPVQASRGITRWVLEQKKAARVSNVHLDPLWRDIYISASNETVSELDVPLIDGNEVIGVLNFESTKEGAFDQEDEDFLLTLAGQAVLAVKNAQAYEREKRLAAEARVLNEISREITSQLDLDRVFDLILEKALELTDSNLGNLMLYNPDQNDFWMAAERGVAQDKKGKGQKMGQGVVGHAARDKQLLNVDLTQHPWNEIYLEFFPGARSELAVPMLAGDVLWGVLNIESPNHDNFSESDEHLLTGLASLAIVALQNAQAYKREKVLNEISKEITSQLDLDRVFDLILEKALELTHSHMGNLMLYDPEMGDLWMATESGVVKEKKGQRQYLGQGIVGRAAQDKQLLNIADVTQPPWNEIFLHNILGTRSEIAVPMLAGNDLRGVLNVESPVPNNFRESDERLLQGLADMAVVALQNAQAYERERRLVTESQRLVKEGQLLNAISKEITSQLDFATVFNLILEKALELTSSTLGALLLYDPDLNDLWTVASRGIAEDKKGVRLSLQQGIVGYVARHKKLINADLSQPVWKEVYIELVPGMRSELAVPMLAGEDLRGVLYVEGPNPRNFSERDERLLQGLGDLAVVALQNAERYEQARREVQRFELLYQAGQELGKISELSQREQTYDIILHIAEKYCDGQIVIRLYEGETKELIAIRASYHQYSPPFPRMKLDEGINGQVVRERRTLILYDTSRPPLDVVPAKLSDPTVRSLIVTPIMFKERYYGNLGLSHKKVGHFRDADVHFFEGLTQQLASTIYRLETAQERQEFEQRIVSAEAMSSIGQITFELTHRWGNDLGLVRSYVNDIRTELKSLNATSPFIAEKLENIVGAAGAVLNLSKELKQALVRTGEAITGEPVIIETGILLEEAQDAASVPSNIQICQEIDEDVAAVRVIHSLVADILRNLMTNAIDAMPEGGRITLRAHNTGHFVALEVIDTGVGIPQQNLSKIFDLFYSTKGSSGFGLWSARTNALRNHGDLTVNSQEGQGTTFTLLLPRAERQ